MKKFILLLFGLILLQTFTLAQFSWVELNGPTGGEFRILCLNSENDVFIASKGKGVFYSTNQGNNWNKIIDGLITLDFLDMIFCNENLLLSTNSSGVYKFNSSDSSWSQFNFGLPAYELILTFSADQSGTIYAGTEYGKLYKLPEAGNSWQLVYASDTISNISELHIDSSAFYLLCNDYMFPLFGGLFKSTNQGANWTKIGPEEIHNGCSSFATDSQGYIYFSHNNTILSSSDSGQNWYTAEPFGGLEHNCQDILSIEGSNLFALITNVYSGSPDDNERLITSSDHGVTWQDLELYGFDLWDIEYDKINNIIYIGTSKGVFKSNNLGYDWIDINSNLDKVWINNLITDINGNIYVSTEVGIFRLFKSSFEWEFLYNGILPFANVAHFDSILYAYNGKGLFTYNELTNIWDFKYMFGAYDFDRDVFGNLYMLGHSNVMKSTDAGTIWLSMVFSNQSFNSFKCLKDSLILIASNSGIVRSTNSGNSWLSVEVNYGIDELFYNGDSLVIAVNNLYCARSLDLGLTWEELVLPDLIRYSIYDVIFPSYNEVYAVATFDYLGYSAPIILFSNDFGFSWSKINSPGVLLFINYSEVDSTVYSGFRASLYKSTFTPTDIFETISSEYTEMTLIQNYPNPFNPITKINYSINKNEFVSIKVFDVLGKEVTTLMNEEKPSGNYEVYFNASNLASGIYYYQLRAGEFVETKKMILLK